MGPGRQRVQAMERGRWRSRTVQPVGRRTGKPTATCLGTLEQARAVGPRTQANGDLLRNGTWRRIMAPCSAAALRPIPPSPQPPGAAPAAGHAGSAAPQPRPASQGKRGGGDRRLRPDPELIGPQPLPIGQRRTRALRCLALLALLLASAGCQPAHLRPSWRVYPLPRQVANDGLAVVNQPDGYGLHIWVETDTSLEGVCRPRWNPAAARLFNGNGSAPFSSGLATPAEFYEAVRRGPVRQALRHQIQALCRQRAPRSDFVWSEPPRRAADYKPPPLASLEERHLLSDPEAIKRAEQKLLGVPPGEQDADAGQPTSGQTQPAAGQGKPPAGRDSSAAGQGTTTAGRGNSPAAPRPQQAR